MARDTPMRAPCLALLSFAPLLTARAVLAADPFEIQVYDGTANDPATAAFRAPGQSRLFGPEDRVSLVNTFNYISSVAMCSRSWQDIIWHDGEGRETGGRTGNRVFA